MDVTTTGLPMTTSEVSVSTDYPFGLTLWAYIVVCCMFFLASCLFVVCFISAIKAVRDRGLIKKRIEEKRREQLRKEAEKEAATNGSDKEPLTHDGIEGEVEREGEEEEEEEEGEEGGGEELIVNNTEKVSKHSVEDETGNSHVVEVTIHGDIDATPTPDTTTHDTHIDIAYIDTIDAHIDHDSAIESATNSDGENQVAVYNVENEGDSGRNASPRKQLPWKQSPGEQSPWKQSPGEQSPWKQSPSQQTNGCDSPIQDQKSNIVNENIISRESSKEEDAQQCNNMDDMMQINTHKTSEYNIDVLGTPIVNESVSTDLPSSTKSTPERKKTARIGTPTKFFSPKKGKDEKLVEALSPEGNKGLDNMAFDEHNRC